MSRICSAGLQAGILLLACLLGTFTAAEAHNRVLVLLDDVESKDDYSSFFESLASQGFDLEYKRYKDAGLKLKDYDTWRYEHLMLFAPGAASFGGAVNNRAILDFVDAGNNLVLALGSNSPNNLRTLASEFGVDLDDQGTAVYDHLSHAADDKEHTLIVADDVVKSAAILPSPLQGPVLFRGIAQSVPGDSELVTVAVSASPTAYSHDAKKSVAEPPSLIAGATAALVTLVQARNNARVLISGSLDLFSDELFQASGTVAGSGERFAKSGNAELCAALAGWTLQRSGVLRAENLRHRVLDSSEVNPALYRVNDEVEFAVDIFEYEGGSAGGARRPYDADDVQMEFTMLDPHVRLTLKHDGKGTYSVQFKVPDVYGVFKYVIDYRHRGYSYVQLTHQVPVRPYRHNEYERFLTAAFPYYASALSSMVAFFVLGIVFLYSK